MWSTRRSGGASGYGPIAGAGNVEVCAATVLLYVMADRGLPADTVDLRLVGSHALMAYGAAVVPHHLRIEVEGEDVTAGYDLAAILSSWPEPIEWGRTDRFSLFAASAVKNAVALVGEVPTRTHMSGPVGMPGGYPVKVAGGRVELDLPGGLSSEDAIATNDAAARFDAIDRVEGDGTVVYTSEARGRHGEHRLCVRGDHVRRVAQAVPDPPGVVPPSDHKERSTCLSSPASRWKGSSP